MDLKMLFKHPEIVNKSDRCLMSAPIFIYSKKKKKFAEAKFFYFSTHVAYYQEARSRLALRYLIIH